MSLLLITGGNGQVASEYKLSKPVNGWDYIFLDREDLDITKYNKVVNIVKTYNPDAILNLAAYTDVEKSEKKETEKAYNINAIGPKNLAIVCKANNIPLIHISTDYVFDGTSQEPYTEKHLENPINQYGRTKFMGEKFIQESCDWYYIIRTSWVYSNHGNNFLNTMLKLAQERTELNVIDDQIGSPTSAKELCKCIDKILENNDKKLSGIYHFSGIGKTTWKDFADEIFNQTQVTIIVNGISTDKWKSELDRPKYSYMSSSKFSETFKYVTLHWKNALKNVIAERKQIPIKVGDMVTIEEMQCIVVSTDWIKKIARISNPANMSTSVEIEFDKLVL